MIKFLSDHYTLFQLNRESELPSQDIVALPFYSRPLEWLADGLVFEKVPRIKLEEELSAVASVGFIKDISEDDFQSKWYNYEIWTHGIID